MKLHEISYASIVQQLLTEMEKYQATDTSGMHPLAALDLIQKQFDAARRALGITNKLKNPEERKKYKARTLGAMNTIRAAIRRLEKQIASEDMAVNVVEHLSSLKESVKTVLTEMWTDEEPDFNDDIDVDRAIAEYGFNDIVDDASPFIVLGLPNADEKFEDYISDYPEYQNMPREAQQQVHAHSAAVLNELISKEYRWYSPDSMGNFKQFVRQFDQWWAKPNAAELHKQALVQFMKEVRNGEFLWDRGAIEQYVLQGREDDAVQRDFIRSHNVASDNPSLGRR